MAYTAAIPTFLSVYLQAISRLFLQHVQRKKAVRPHIHFHNRAIQRRLFLRDRPYQLRNLTA